MTKYMIGINIMIILVLFYIKTAMWVPSYSSLNLKSINTHKIENKSYYFSYCTHLIHIILPQQVVIVMSYVWNYGFNLSLTDNALGSLWVATVFFWTGTHVLSHVGFLGIFGLRGISCVVLLIESSIVSVSVISVPSWIMSLKPVFGMGFFESISVIGGPVPGIISRTIIKAKRQLFRLKKVLPNCPIVLIIHVNMLQFHV